MELGMRPLLAFAAAVLAGPLAGPLSAGGCTGCAGLTNHGGSSVAPCSGTPQMNWQISVAYEIESGSCDDHISGTTLTCDPEPCSGTVTYAWGAAMGGSITDVGYHQARPSNQPATSWKFGPEPPWEAGKAGSVAFGPDADPTLGCGQVYSFFIKADHQEEGCGPIEASVWASCTACGVKAGS